MHVAQILWPTAHVPMQCVGSKIPFFFHTIQYLQIIQRSQVLLSRVRLGHYENTLVTIQCDLKIFFALLTSSHELTTTTPAAFVFEVLTLVAVASSGQSL